MSSPLAVFLRRGSGDRLDGLQAGRAVAATMVVLYHANDFVLPLRLYDGEIAWRGFGWGYAGVEFFFVLSGFIIAHVHAGDVGRPGRIGRFLEKRVRRIYPFYWLVLTVAILVYAAWPGAEPGSDDDAWTLLRSYLLLPSDERSVLPVAWTLHHEVVFYLAFIAFLVSPVAGSAVFGLWMLLCVAALFAPPSSFPATFIASPYNLLFALGMLSARVWPLLSLRLAPSLLVLGIIGFSAIGFSEQYLFDWTLGARTLSYGVAAAAVVIALARRPPVLPDWVVYLGDASFAVYLVHLPAMNLAALVLARIGAAEAVPTMVMLTCLCAFAVFAGVVAHAVIERPLLNSTRFLSATVARRIYPARVPERM